MLASQHQRTEKGKNPSKTTSTKGYYAFRVSLSCLLSGADGLWLVYLRSTESLIFDSPVYQQMKKKRALSLLSTGSTDSVDCGLQPSG